MYETLVSPTVILVEGLRLWCLQRHYGHWGRQSVKNLIKTAIFYYVLTTFWLDPVEDQIHDLNSHRVHTLGRSNFLWRPLLNFKNKGSHFQSNLRFKAKGSRFLSTGFETFVSSAAF